MELKLKDKKMRKMRKMMKNKCICNNKCSNKCKIKIRYNNQNNYYNKIWENKIFNNKKCKTNNKKIYLICNRIRINTKMLHKKKVDLEI